MIRVGVGGWVFAPWRGEFYPKGLPQARELEYASRKLTTIEINGTFYGSQKPAPPASDFENVFRCSINSSTTGLGVRLFKVTTATGHGRAGKSTGNAFSEKREA